MSLEQISPAVSPHSEWIIPQAPFSNTKASPVQGLGFYIVIHKRLTELQLIGSH